MQLVLPPSPGGGPEGQQKLFWWSRAPSFNCRTIQERESTFHATGEGIGARAFPRAAGMFAAVRGSKRHTNTKILPMETERQSSLVSVATAVVSGETHQFHGGRRSMIHEFICGMFAQARGPRVQGLSHLTIPNDPDVSSAPKSRQNLVCYCEVIRCLSLIPVDDLSPGHTELPVGHRSRTVTFKKKR